LYPTPVRSATSRIFNRWRIKLLLNIDALCFTKYAARNTSMAGSAADGAKSDEDDRIKF
jgi:hypothetical protein